MSLKVRGSRRPAPAARMRSRRRRTAALRNVSRALLAAERHDAVHCAEPRTLAEIKFL